MTLEELFITEKITLNCEEVKLILTSCAFARSEYKYIVKEIEKEIIQNKINKDVDKFKSNLGQASYYDEKINELTQLIEKLQDAKQIIINNDLYKGKIK